MADGLRHTGYRVVTKKRELSRIALGSFAVCIIKRNYCSSSNSCGEQRGRALLVVQLVARLLFSLFIVY